MIVVDTNFLIFLLDPSLTEDDIELSNKVRYFIEGFSKTREDIIIAAPTISELVAGRVDKVFEIMEELRKISTFLLVPFDVAIAIEAGERIASVQPIISQNEKTPSWKVAMKYDAMIAATAIVRHARAIYTRDTGFKKYLEGTGIEIILLDDLPSPPTPKQISMDI